MAALGRADLALIEARQVVTLAADARQRLRRLHYQRTDTLSRGGAIGGPGGTGVSLGTTQEFAEQAMTMPELIDDYRDFVERVVGGLQQKVQEEREHRARAPSGLYFLLTVRQLFTQPPDVVRGLAWLGGDASRTRGERPHWLDSANPVLRDLARARIALGASPYLAAELISAARGQLSGHPGFGAGAEPGFLSDAPAGLTADSGKH